MVAVEMEQETVVNIQAADIQGFQQYLEGIHLRGFICDIFFGCFAVCRWFFIPPLPHARHTIVSFVHTAAV